MSIRARFEISHTQYIDASGQETQALPAFCQDTDLLKKLYRMMVLTRTFDQKSIALQRTGRLGTYPSILGQEATSVGLGAAMAKEDVLVPYFRDQGAQLWRGVKMEEILIYWGGSEWGSHFESPLVKDDFPINVPIATQAAHATGVAHALKLRGEKRAVVCVMGDGATSKGEVYEAMNLAGTWQLPVVFVVNNNRWAISVPLSKQTGAETLAQKGISAGIPSQQVDGNDVIAVYDCVSKALLSARETGQSHFIEALTYRLGDHTTADDATKYRNPEEVSHHWKLDPLARLRTFLGNKGIWTKDQEEELIRTSKDQVDEAIHRYETTPAAPATEMFDYLYETLPKTLEIQRAHLQEKVQNVHSRTGKEAGAHG